MRGKPTLTMDEAARQRAIASVRRYAEEELEVEIGDLKADLLLRYVLEEIGPTIYNQAIADARAFFEERAADLDAVCFREEFPYWTRR